MYKILCSRCSCSSFVVVSFTAPSEGAVIPHDIFHSRKEITCSCGITTMEHGWQGKVYKLLATSYSSSKYNADREFYPERVLADGRQTIALLSHSRIGETYRVKGIYLLLFGVAPYSQPSRTRSRNTIHKVFVLTQTVSFSFQQFAFTTPTTTHNNEPNIKKTNAHNNTHNNIHNIQNHGKYMRSFLDLRLV